MSYWVIKRGDEYLVSGQSFLKEQVQAYRFFVRPNPRPGERVVRVVPRPRPDLAARLAAWEQTLRAIAYYDLSREELRGIAAEALEEHRRRSYEVQTVPRPNGKEMNDA